MDRKHRRSLAFLLLLAAAAMEWISLADEIPDHLLVARDGSRERLLEQALPGWIDEQVKAVSGQQLSDIPRENLHMEGMADGGQLAGGGNALSVADSYTLECSLFGVVPIKDIQVDVVERQQLIPSGVPVGIYMKTDGVLIVGTGEVCDINGLNQEPGGDIVHSGDYILAVNNVPVTKKEEVVEQINQAVGNEVKLTVLRKGEQTELLVPVVQTGSSEYKAGIWIRDDTQGIGTLTYMTKDGDFGALGHGISDVDTSTLLDLASGTLYRTDIRAVVKGENGAPGELAGTIRYNREEVLGSISVNTGIGIFGTITADDAQLAYSDAVDIAYKQEVRTGSAQILSAVDGEVKPYDIEIEKVNLNSGDANKSMVIRVTDEKLLELTGGIVQGMRMSYN